MVLTLNQRLTHGELVISNCRRVTQCLQEVAMISSLSTKADTHDRRELGMLATVGATETIEKAAEEELKEQPLLNNAG